jgi:hypothetical protein
MSRAGARHAFAPSIHQVSIIRVKRSDVFSHLGQSSAEEFGDRLR